MLNGPIWLQMDPYEALGHEKRLAPSIPVWMCSGASFPEIGPLHQREFADSWNLDHIVCHKLCSLPVGLWLSKFDCRRSEQYCGRNLKIPPHLRQRVYVAGGPSRWSLSRGTKFLQGGDINKNLLHS